MINRVSEGSGGAGVARRGVQGDHRTRPQKPLSSPCRSAIRASRSPATSSEPSTPAPAPAPPRSATVCWNRRSRSRASGAQKASDTNRSAVANGATSARASTATFVNVPSSIASPNTASRRRSASAGRCAGSALMHRAHTYSTCWAHPYHCTSSSSPLTALNARFAQSTNGRSRCLPSLKQFTSPRNSCFVSVRPSTSAAKPMALASDRSLGGRDRRPATAFTPPAPALNRANMPCTTRSHSSSAARSVSPQVGASAQKAARKVASFSADLPVVSWRSENSRARDCLPRAMCRASAVSSRCAASRRPPGCAAARARARRCPALSTAPSVVGPVPAATAAKAPASGAAGASSMRVIKRSSRPAATAGPSPCASALPDPFSSRPGTAAGSAAASAGGGGRPNAIVNRVSPNDHTSQCAPCAPARAAFAIAPW